MSNKQSEQSLDQAVMSVRKSVEEQRRNSETQPSHTSQSKNTKNIIAIVLCIASAALIMYCFEYVAKPNQWPDLQTSPRIVQASFANLARARKLTRQRMALIRLITNNLYSRDFP